MAEAVRQHAPGQSPPGRRAASAKVPLSKSKVAVEARKRMFLQEYERHGVVAEACRVVGIRRKAPYDWAVVDPEFKAAMEEAQEVATDALVLEALRRAKEGVEEPVYQGGRLVGTKTVYSDTLMLAALRAYRPERFAKPELSFGHGEIGQVTFSLDFGFRPLQPEAPRPTISENGSVEPQEPPGDAESAAAAGNLPDGVPDQGEAHSGSGAWGFGD